MAKFTINQMWGEDLLTRVTPEGQREEVRGAKETTEGFRR